MADAQTLVLLPGLLNTRRVFRTARSPALADIADAIVPELWHHDSIGAMAEAALAAAPPTLRAGRLLDGRLRRLRDPAPRARAGGAAGADRYPGRARHAGGRRARRRGFSSRPRSAASMACSPRCCRSSCIAAASNDPAVVQPILDMAQEIGADGFVREQTAIIARPDSRPLLVEIDVPTVVIVGRQDQATPLPRAQEMAADIAHSRLVVHRGMRPHGAAGEAGRSLGRAQEMVDAMTTPCTPREDYLGADEYIDVVKKSGLNRPVEDRGRVERMLSTANLIVTARQDGTAGRLRPLADRFLLLLLSVRPRRRQGLPGPGHRQAADRGDARARPAARSRRRCCCRRRRR